MPTELKASGPDIRFESGQVRTPMAAVHFCEGCGYENAAFGIKRGEETLSYCGWVNGHPECVGKGRKV